MRDFALVIMAYLGAGTLAVGACLDAHEHGCLTVVGFVIFGLAIRALATRRIAEARERGRQDMNVTMNVQTEGRVSPEEIEIVVRDALTRTIGERRLR